MRHLDLGVLEGPLLLFGGPYSNAQALGALVLEAQNAGFAPEAMICTGDVVAYCAQPAATVAVMRALQAQGMTVIAGNVERQLAAHAPDCGCGFDEGTTCDRLSAGWYGFADRHLGREERRWMAGLPDIASFSHHGRRYAVIHGGATDVARFLWECSPEGDFAAELRAIAAIAGPVDGVIAGHSGLPFLRRVAGVDWINAGVIGMPPNDGAPQTRYAVLEAGVPGIRTLDYDAAGAHAHMAGAGLTQGYDAALLSGWWPSEDVLPGALRRQSLARG